MYDDLPSYTVLGVVNLRTGELMGQMDDHNDLDVAQVLEWADEANQ